MFQFDICVEWTGNTRIFAIVPDWEYVSLSKKWENEKMNKNSILSVVSIPHVTPSANSCSLRSRGFANSHQGPCRTVTVSGCLKTIPSTVNGIRSSLSGFQARCMWWPGDLVDCYFFGLVTSLSLVMNSSYGFFWPCKVSSVTLSSSGRPESGGF